MLRIFYSLLLLILAACTPLTSSQQLPEDCQASAAQTRLIRSNWLQQPKVWRLRQAALLEIGGKKIPLEGFLQLDLVRREARLLAMNAMGLVLFDLQVSDNDQQLLRAIPQLEKVEKLAAGVAQSLRQIFLQPQPHSEDHLENLGNRQRIWRLLPDGSLGFIYDCSGELRETRLVAASGNWRVRYDLYRSFGSMRLPGEIVMDDYQHGVKLSIWINEVKQQP